MSEHATCTIGLDLGDKFSAYCLLDESGEVTQSGKVATRAEALRQFFTLSRMRVVLETGTHSPWVGELIGELGHEVLIANARKLNFIYEDSRKSDQTDAEALARFGRVDPKVLHPITPRDPKARRGQVAIRARSALVDARTQLICSARALVKSFGGRMPSCSADSFAKHTDDLPTELRAFLQPMLEAIGTMTRKIQVLDKRIQRICEEEFPETTAMTTVPGVAHVTALTYVTALGSSDRFANARSAGAFIGLRPRRDQSGETDKHLRITKEGNSYLRKLLVGSAQYILGPFGPDSDLRRWGLNLMGPAPKKGAKKCPAYKSAKKRAAVAVARKLAVILMQMWKTGEVFRAFRNPADQTTKAA